MPYTLTQSWRSPIHNFLYVAMESPNSSQGEALDMEEKGSSRSVYDALIYSQMQSWKRSKERLNIGLRRNLKLLSLKGLNIVLGEII